MEFAENQKEMWMAERLALRLQLQEANGRAKDGRMAQEEDQASDLSESEEWVTGIGSQEKTERGGSAGDGRRSTVKYDNPFQAAIDPTSDAVLHLPHLEYARRWQQASDDTDDTEAWAADQVSTPSDQSDTATDHIFGHPSNPLDPSLPDRVDRRQALIKEVQTAISILAGIVASLAD